MRLIAWICAQKFAVNLPHLLALELDIAVVCESQPLKHWPTTINRRSISHPQHAGRCAPLAARSGAATRRRSTTQARHPHQQRDRRNPCTNDGDDSRCVSTTCKLRQASSQAAPVAVSMPTSPT